MLFRATLLVSVASIAGGWLAVQAPHGERTYVGSAACVRCHAPIANRYAQTRMANVLKDPREHPEAILGDFTQASDVRTFTKAQIAFVYGSKYKQRYFTRRGEDLFTLPATWDV